jgi:uncharacterized BrkB/YihY/UPF0761 family membrane protein
MATQRQPPSAETMRQRSIETVQTVERRMKPCEELLSKCKDDWIHHLAQALAFSLLTALVPMAILLLAMVGVILGRLNVQAQHMLTVLLETIIPLPLAAPGIAMLSKAFALFSQTSGVVAFFTICWRCCSGPSSFR